MRVSWISALFVLSSCASPPPKSAECISTPPLAPEPEPDPGQAPSSTTTLAIPFDLPRAAEVHASPAVAPPPGVTYEEMKPMLAITIDKEGTVFFDAKVLGDPRELVTLTRSLMEREPDSRVVIRADREATWSSVVQALDLVRQAGASRIAFAVEPGPR